MCKKKFADGSRLKILSTLLDAPKYDLILALDMCLWEHIEGSFYGKKWSIKSSKFGKVLNSPKIISYSIITSLEIAE